MFLPLRFEHLEERKGKLMMYFQVNEKVYMKVCKQVRGKEEKKSREKEVKKNQL
jgi:hypothetical protein